MLHKIVIFCLFATIGFCMDKYNLNNEAPKQMGEQERREYVKSVLGMTEEEMQAIEEDNRQTILQYSKKTEEEKQASLIRSQKIMAIIDQFAEDIKKKKNIIFRAYGFVSTGPDKVYDGKIHALDLGYSIDKNLKFKEARKYFYELADTLVQTINSHPEIGKYFYHFPIGYEDLELSLSFDYEDKGHLKKDDIDSIYIQKNQIIYFVVDNEETVDKMKMDQITPDIYILRDFASRSHSIRRPLPEKDFDD
jgi:hypothetical protein